jgi:hypothetical protein
VAKQFKDWKTSRWHAEDCRSADFLKRIVQLVRCTARSFLRMRRPGSADRTPPLMAQPATGRWREGTRDARRRRMAGFFCSTVAQLLLVLMLRGAAARVEIITGEPLHANSLSARMSQSTVCHTPVLC